MKFEHREAAASPDLRRRVDQCWRELGTERASSYAFLFRKEKLKANPLLLQRLSRSESGMTSNEVEWSMKLMDKRRAMLVQIAAAAAIAALVFMGTARAQEQSRWSVNETFQGSSNAAGQVLKLDTSIGYSFNPHFEIGLGVPFYFVRPGQDTTSTSEGFRSGLGNAYVNLRGRMSGPRTMFTSTLTGAAPTGNRDEGFSTGRVTVDWNNHFSVQLGRWTP